MRKRLTKDQVLTIPNAMTAFRLLLVGFILWTYLNGRETVAVCLVLLSALTDMFDGVVARKLNMVSDLGKVLDPLADKLTHLALLICLITRHRNIVYLLMLMVVKEALVVTLGSLVFRRRDSVHSAQWHGKLCTVVFETTMLVLMLFPHLPERAVNAMIAFCAAFMLLSLVLYLLFYAGLLREKDKPE